MNSDSQFSVNVFPDVEQLSLCQNAVKMEAREQITDGQTIPFDQTASQQCVRNSLKKKMSQKGAILRR